MKNKIKILHATQVEINVLNIKLKSDFDILPAVTMDLKQDFWSILGQMTYFARGRRFRNVSRHNIRVIPVAMGTTNAEATDGTPAHKISIEKKMAR